MSDITMPKMGFDMTEGTIVRWLKKVGDEVKKGEAIAEIETDKVTIEIESFDSGTLTQIVADEGSVVPVGNVIGVLGSPGAATAGNGGQPASPPAAAAPAAGEGGEAAASEAQQTAAAATGEPPSTGLQHGYGSDVSASQEIAGAPAAPAGASAPQVGEKIQPVSAGREGERIFASPMARRLASEAGLQLAEIQGSGPGGRIVRRDVEGFARQPARPAVQAAAAPVLAAPTAPAPTPAPAAAPTATPAAPTPAPGPGVRREPISRLRQTIARRMVQSKTTVPHFYVTVSIDMTAAMALRKQLNALEGVKISVNDLVVKGCAVVLKQFPVLNASFAEDSFDYHDYVHISVAVATDNGLLAPAVTDVDKKSIGVVAAETRELADRTRAGKATPEELTRGTFTVSNLGMFGQIESFIAIVNPPHAAILAVGTAIETPVVKDGQVTVAPIMKATISVDHRVGDGAIAAQFLQALKDLLEAPMRLLV